MKRRSILMFAITTVIVLGVQSAAAQFTITIPGFPKVKKPKIEQQTTTTTSDQTDTDQSTDSSSQRSDEPMDARLSMFLDDIAKAQNSVDIYTEADRLYLVSQVESEWLLRAISAKARAEFDTKWQSLMTPSVKIRFDNAFQTLAASAAKKLPSYKVNLADFKIRNAADEKAMRTELTQIANYKIYATGLMEANWLIDKNEFGIPKSRYKHGAFWIRDIRDDHPYCTLTYVNVIQNYAGGGTYGTSYGYFVRDELIACPAAK